MKTRIFSLVLMLIVLAGSASAFGRIMVLSMHYDGEITANDKVIKFGHYPDRKIQAEDGYICEIVSDEEEVLYSFRFEIPSRIYMDVSDERTKELSGGYIDLEETDFSLILPYFDNAKEVRIYKPLTANINKLKLSVDVEEIYLSRGSRIFVTSSLIFAGIMLFLFVLISKKIVKKR